MEGNRLKAADVLRMLGEIIKNALRYPFSLRKKVFWTGEPQAWFGLTDHPLDRYGGQISDPFSAVKKLTGKKASCVLGVESAERTGNSFVFRARGYNVYTLRDTSMSAASHEYLVKKRTRYRQLTLRIDILRPDAYRLRLAEGNEVPEHATEMVCGDISRDTAVSFSEEGGIYRIATDALRLDIHKERFRIDIRDAEGTPITESSGQTKSEWALAMDSWPLGFVRDRDSGMTYGVESFVLYPGEAVYGFGEKKTPESFRQACRRFMYTENLMPEAAIVLGSVAVVPFALPGTEEVVRAIEPLIEDHKTFIMSHHGALTLGKDPFDAYNRMETLERICKIYLNAKLLGTVHPIPDEAFDYLLKTALNGRLD
jgi:hypothetical protein